MAEITSPSTTTIIGDDGSKTRLKSDEPVSSDSPSLIETATDDPNLTVEFSNNDDKPQFRPWGTAESRFMDACGWGLSDVDEVGVATGEAGSIITDDARTGYAGDDVHSLEVPADARRSISIPPHNTSRMTFAVWVRTPVVPTDALDIFRVEGLGGGRTFDTIGIGQAQPADPSHRDHCKPTINTVTRTVGNEIGETSPCPDDVGGPPFESVRDLQRHLNALDYDAGPVDGFLGAKTESATKSFQTDEELTADGIVGTATWDALHDEWEAGTAKNVLYVRRSGTTPAGVPYTKPEPLLELWGLDPDTWFPLILQVNWRSDKMEARLQVGLDGDAVVGEYTLKTDHEGAWELGPSAFRLLAESGGTAQAVRFDDLVICHTHDQVTDAYPLLAYRAPEASDASVTYDQTTVDVDLFGVSQAVPLRRQAPAWLVETAGGETELHEVTDDVPSDDDTTYVHPDVLDVPAGVPVVSDIAHGSLHFFADKAARDTWLGDKNVVFAHAGFRARAADTESGSVGVTWPHPTFDAEEYQRTPRGSVDDAFQSRRAFTAKDIYTAEVPWVLHLVSGSKELRVTQAHAIYGYHTI